MSETSEIVGPAIKALNAIPGVVAYRVFTGKAKVRGGYVNGAPEGFPDIGVVIRGRPIYLEAKLEAGGITSLEQLKMHDRLRRAGAEVHLIKSVGAAIAVAQKALGNL